MSRQRITSLLVATLVALPATASGQSAWSTDRPGATENPFTVPVGRVQAEFGLASLERGGQASRLEVAATNLRVGVTPNIDLQLSIAPLVQDRVRAPGGPVQSTTGLGDITVRAKVNLFGNAGGDLAVGVMPFVSLLPDEHGERESRLGVIIPLAMDMGAWDLGTTVTIGHEHREYEDGYRGFIESAISGSRQVTQSVQGFVELWSGMAAEPRARWQASANGGAAWQFSETMQVDGGVNVGLTRATPALNPFVGLSIRF